MIRKVSFTRQHKFKTVEHKGCPRQPFLFMETEKLSEECVFDSGKWEGVPIWAAPTEALLPVARSGANNAFASQVRREIERREKARKQRASRNRSRRGQLE